MGNRFARLYPENALLERDDLDVISPEIAPTLDALFQERLRRSPQSTAYIEYSDSDNCWHHYLWKDVANEVVRWQSAFRRQGFVKGDRVAIRLRNCRHWVIFDQAALGLGLVVVPLYVADRPDNVNYVLTHSGAKFLFVENESAWLELLDTGGDTLPIEHTVVLRGDSAIPETQSVEDWLRDTDDSIALSQGITRAEDLASIVYTSGTTGRPKGVMLSHSNFVQNAYSGLKSAAISPEDVMLSFLPLSHALERTVGYYVPLMAGAQVAYNRSLKQLSEDLITIKPNGLITVPKIFERSYSMVKERLRRETWLKRWIFDIAVKIGWLHFNHQQRLRHWTPALLFWPILDRVVAKKVRARFGGRLGVVVVGGAPCPPMVSKVFIALGIPLLQGYGLTETSPSVSINTLKRNRPETIGLPLRDVEVKIGEDDELLVRGPNVMLGYWKNEAATRTVLDEDGWLRTGDQATIEDGFLRIIGRLKDILVLANGEKVPPADMEAAITEDTLFEQAMIVGEQMPFLTALVVLNKKRWEKIVQQMGIPKEDKDDDLIKNEHAEQFILNKIGELIDEFPGYAKVERVTASLIPWTVENEMLTPTLKIKRPKILDYFKPEIERMYQGHDLYRIEQKKPK